MSNIAFQNLIGGKELLLSGRSFFVESEIYPEYRFSVPESSLFDIKTAISKAKSSSAECRNLTFTEKIEILERAAEKFLPNEEEIEYAVKNTGMPIKVVREFSKEIPQIFKNLPKKLEQHIGLVDDKFGHKLRHTNGTVIFEPVNGIVYAVTPGNDIRVTAFIASWLVALGLSGVFKCSKNDLAFSQSTIRALIGAGYPSGALNVLCWDTSKAENLRLNFEVVDASKIVWAYGADSTVDIQLRTEEKPNGEIRDHFSDKIILRHATGRAAAIYESATDLEKTAQLIVDSSLKWPIGCNSLKMLFDTSNSYGDLIQILKEKFESIGKYAGDPMNPKTEIGFTSPKLLNHLHSRLLDLQRANQVNIITGKILSENQSTPFLCETKNPNSELLNTEYSTYLLTIKKNNSFDEAINEANESAGMTKRLIISIFSKDRESINKKVLSHRVTSNYKTTELDLLFHEGNDYFHRLTIPQIHG